MIEPLSPETLHRILGPVFERAKVGLCVTDEEGRIIAANPEVSRMFQMSNEEIVGRNFLIFVPKRDRRAARRAFDAVRNGGYLEQPDWYAQLRDGDFRWIRVAPSFVEITEGTQAILSVLTDVTPSRNAEAARREAERESEQTLRKILDVALDAVVMLDTRGTILEWRGASEGLLGWSSEETVGQSFVELLVPDQYRNRVVSGLRKFETEGDRSLVGAQTEMEVLTKRGSEVSIELSISAVSTGNRTLLCAFLHDLTVRRIAEGKARDINRMLEQRVQERTAELEAAFEELEGFSYSVSHDLRAPLRSINGFATLLVNEYRDQIGPDGLEHLQKIVTSTKRMARLIDDLLGFARLARVEVRKQDVDLTRMASETAQEVRYRWKHAVEFFPQPDLVTCADPALVRLLLTNLLENAWKFTSKTAGARVEVGLDPERGFYVKDNGAGFEPAYAPRLFRPFERLHSASEFPGSGIGLANVERVVRRHGGSMSAEGEPGKGATFFFTLGNS